MDIVSSGCPGWVPRDTELDAKSPGCVSLLLSSMNFRFVLQTSI